MNTNTKVEKRANGGTERVREEFLSPLVNITETSDGYLLEAEMPGVNKKGLEILLEANELTLIGRRNLEAADDLVYREIAPASFKRVFSLDPTLDISKVDARLENGLLRLTLPKAEKVKPRRITIND